MSTRWYPIYQRGNPQLRVFLPNFWLKLIRPEYKQPPNVVQFACSMEMTRYDVKNYLEKIYKVPVVSVRTRIALGNTKRDLVLGYITKEEDTKYAYVTLPNTVKFDFPDVCPNDAQQKIEDDKKSLEDAKKNHKKFLDKNKDRPGTPGWFSI
uniref:Large ribosomal subunit protein uL23m n=1 Tax=Anopheles farauti TaxID=69004 RepID=A0A2C9GW57_9DIPT